MASVPPQGGRKHPHQEFIQIDTTNILFICGGAFDGLEKTDREAHQLPRLRDSARISPGSTERDVARSMAQVQHARSGPVRHDPGACRPPAGRCTLSRALSAMTLVRILTEPKNAMTQASTRLLMSYDGVDLEYEPAALEAIADKAIEDEDRRARPAQRHGGSHDRDPRTPSLRISRQRRYSSPKSASRTARAPRSSTAKNKHIQNSGKEKNMTDSRITCTRLRCPANAATARTARFPGHDADL